MSNPVVVEAYGAQWPDQFLKLKERIWPSVKGFALGIEHVGSTSVPGLAAKPVIDLDIIIPDKSFLDEAVRRLAKLGYEHRGNLGIEDRDAFRPKNEEIRHNLYVCPQGSVSLRNHISLRDALRAHPELRDEYASLKYSLAERFPGSIDDYIEGKTDFILKVLRSHGYDSDSLESIRIANLAQPKARD